ncbi:cell division protein ZipA C-terminal FtsZ-binding domain-containing protein [Thiobacter aerophilum]|uniref:Cell division protein ZipA n=1 Tax=Thiobacter aerophilum TaxID=3121275 RepID=A0ABV0EAP1_9BURK
MNDLQLSLLALGALVILGVVAYNAWQERRFRKLAQERFQAQRDDVLFGATRLGKTPSQTRIEPTVSPALAPGEPEVLREPAHPPATPPADAEWPPEVDRAIACVARLELAEPQVGQTVKAALATDMPWDKPCTWYGRTPGGEWMAVAEARESAEFAVVVGALQLADRAGAVTAETVDRFLHQAQEAAARLMAVAQLPEKAATLEAARALDEFCADVDVLVGVNVVAVGQASFPGTQLRALAEAAGLRLSADGTFQYRDEQNNVLYALANQEPAPFEAATLRQFSTHGVTLLFDVPRVAGGLKVFDQMMQFARHLADTLHGTLVDDNLRPLSDEGVAKIRQQLLALYAKMDARGIPAGSAQALRLFS